MPVESLHSRQQFMIITTVDQNLELNIQIDTKIELDEKNSPQEMEIPVCYASQIA
jgi:hypothetical protein